MWRRLIKLVAASVATISWRGGGNVCRHRQPAWRILWHLWPQRQCDGCRWPNGCPW